MGGGGGIHILLYYSGGLLKTYNIRIN